jgi:uncharacterized protein YaaQ
MSSASIHLLMLAVVQDQDLDAVTRALEPLGAPVVYLSSAGGFLGRRNDTLLIGLPDGRETDVFSVLRSACRQRVEYLTMPLEGSPLPMAAPIPVPVGGATVFVLPVESYEEI